MRLTTGHSAIASLEPPNATGESFSFGKPAIP
jgi:hypothetical protein